MSKLDLLMARALVVHATYTYPHWDTTKGHWWGCRECGNRTTFGGPQKHKSECIVGRAEAAIARQL